MATDKKTDTPTSAPKPPPKPEPTVHVRWGGEREATVVVRAKLKDGTWDRPCRLPKSKVTWPQPRSFDLPEAIYKKLDNV